MTSGGQGASVTHRSDWMTSSIRSWFMQHQHLPVIRRIDIICQNLQLLLLLHCRLDQCHQITRACTIHIRVATISRLFTISVALRPSVRLYLSLSLSLRAGVARSLDCRRDRPTQSSASGLTAGGLPPGPRLDTTDGAAWRRAASRWRGRHSTRT